MHKGELKHIRGIISPSFSSYISTFLKLSQAEKGEKKQILQWEFFCYIFDMKNGREASLYTAMKLKGSVTFFMLE